MKTRVHLYNWLLRAVLMLVAMTGSLTTMADDTEIEGGEAFYIYQNDGHFNGFFYDQVKQIRYSRLDTLGREHSDYVSQEIVTEDSVYRIMMTAIDSVSFVQPEIKYAKGVRFMSQEGLMDYFVRYAAGADADSHVLYFLSTVPQALRPKVGDVLSCPKVEGYDGAFVYKVAQVTEQAGELVAVCKPIEELSEVLEQFVTVEQIRNVQTPDGCRMQRRIAGLNTQKRAEGNIEETTLFNIGTTLEGNLVLFGKLKAGLTLGIGFGMTAKAEYKFVSEEWYTKIEMKNQITTNFGLQFDGELYSDADLSALPGVGALVDRFTKIPLPANLPLFYIDVAPKPYTKVEAHINLTMSTGVKVSANYFEFEFQWKKGEYPYLHVLGHPSTPFLPIPSSISGGSEWSINAQLNGAIKSGIKFPIKTKTENWLNKVLTLGMGAEFSAGPKISGAIDFTLLEKGDNGFFSWKRPKETYDLMKGTKLDLSLLHLEAEMVAEAKIIGDALGGEFKRNTSAAFGVYTLKLFPSISGFECDIVGDLLNTVTGKCKVSGDTFMPERVGFGLYKNKDENDKSYSQCYRYVTRDESYFLNTFNSVDLKIEDVAPGIYMAYPVVWTAFGVVPVTSEGQLITIAPQEVELKPSVLIAEEQGGKYEVELLTSFNENLRAMPDDDWVETEIKYNVGSMKSTIMYVTVKENDTDKLRKSSVTVTQILKDGRLCEKKLEVRQFGGLQIEPNELTFEAEGGEELVNVLSSYKPITVNNKADWLDDLYFDEDRQLKLTAKKNEGAQREAVITIAGWSERHQGISQVNLKVTQKGPVDVSLDKEEFEFPANGGGERINVTMGGNYAFTDIVVSKADQTWITAERHDNYFIINAMPNTSAEDRETVIQVVFNKTNPSAPGPATYTIPFTVKQKSAVAKIDKDRLHFYAGGGSDQVKIDFGIYPYCGAYISEDGDGWVDFSVGNDGTVTVTVERNESAVDRKCILVCWVSGKDNPEDKEMVKMPVTIEQDGYTVTPDGDNSPFKFVNFWVTRKIEMVVDGTTYEEPQIADYNQQFKFTPENSHFVVKREKGYIHVECEGLLDSPGTTNSGKTKATLKFDIYGSEKKVKNLTFKSNIHSVLTMGFWGYTGTTASDVELNLSTSDLPLNAYYVNYLECENYTVAKGLNFTNFSSRGHSYTTYTVPAGESPIAPSSEDFSHIAIGDSGDFVDLRIESLINLADLEWPSSEVMTKLKDGGMPMAYGDTPPTVSGTYLMSPVTIVADRMEAAAEMDGLQGLVLKFNSQSKGTISVDYYWIWNDGADDAFGTTTSLIQGSDNEFSVCIPSGEVSTILTGKMTNNGIADLHFAAVHNEMPGIFTILKDNDGNSTKTTWAPATKD